MIIQDTFPGDVNTTLKTVQETWCKNLAPQMFWAAAERYMAAARLLGVETELSRGVRRSHEASHAVLRDAYDIVAARFRFDFDPGGQMLLPFDDEPYSEYLWRHWTAYWAAQIKELAQIDDIVRAVLSIVAFGGEQAGQDAQAKLTRLLFEHYDYPLRRPIDN